MKKTVIIIGVLVVIGGGVAWWFMGQSKPADNATQSSNANQPATGAADTTQSGEVAITMKNTKFDPQHIKIKKGTKVTWTNQDAVRHNVIGDSAQQGGLPDANDLVGNGESYSFTFNSAGTFSYHCMPHPFMTGTVEVVE